MKKKLILALLLTLLASCLILPFTACAPKDYDMSSVKFEDATFTYDGTEKKLEISGTLPSGVTVSYSNNTLTDVGEIVAMAVQTAHPILPLIR